MGCELLEWIPSLVLGVVAAVAVVGPVSRVVASSIEEEKARLHDSLGHVVDARCVAVTARTTPSDNYSAGEQVYDYTMEFCVPNPPYPPPDAPGSPRNMKVTFTHTTPAIYRGRHRLSSCSEGSFVNVNYLPQNPINVRIVGMRPPKRHFVDVGTEVVGYLCLGCFGVVAFVVSLVNAATLCWASIVVLLCIVYGVCSEIRDCSRIIHLARHNSHYGNHVAKGVGLGTIEWVSDEEAAQIMFAPSTAAGIATAVALPSDVGIPLDESLPTSTNVRVLPRKCQTSPRPPPIQSIENPIDTSTCERTYSAYTV